MQRIEAEEGGRTLMGNRKIRRHQDLNWAYFGFYLIETHISHTYSPISTSPKLSCPYFSMLLLPLPTPLLHSRITYGLPL